MPKTGKDAFISRLDAINITPREFLATLDMWRQLPEADKCRFIVEAEDTPAQAERINYKRIQTLFNTTCRSYPAVFSLSEARKKAIKARYNAGYTYDDFDRLFEAAEASDFLKGKNDRGWTANFDWLIKDSNMAKVLDGNYQNNKNTNVKREASFDLGEINSLLNEGAL